MEINKIYNLNCEIGLKEIEDNSIDCCVTSPPYYGLRDYGVSDQIGLEETPEAYIERLVEVFKEVHRVLKPTGTLWLNIGDSYAGSGKGFGGKQEYLSKGENINHAKTWNKIKNKDLIGIPWSLAFALRLEGWYLRQDIIWYKPNAMPESVQDRCGKCHEYLFLLSKSPHYYFDSEAIKQTARNKENRPAGIVRNREYNYNSKPNLHPEAYLQRGLKKQGKTDNTSVSFHGNNIVSLDKVNKRDVWVVPTKPSQEAHFAVFPEELIIDCVKAGCPESGIVLDPFMGTNTTAIVARSLGRNYIGYEINPDYIKIGEKKLYNKLGMFR